jgi:outer membrane receptor protein involved in Fe transport
VLTLFARAGLADGLADEAELQFQLGAERYRAKDFQGALEHFLASNRLVPNRNVRYNIARTFEQLSRFADAHRYYVDALAGETDPRVHEQIEQAIARLVPKVAVLDVVTDPPGATIFIDRRDLGSRGRSPLPLALPPGRYEVLAELEGYESARSGAVVAKLGSSTQVQLTLPLIVGTVRIAGQDGVEVRVDDERADVACKSPCELQLRPGAHVLHFSRAGYVAIPKQVLVVAKTQLAVAPELLPMTGSILVETDERGALVEIDGHAMGFTPVVVPSVPVGARLVRVSLRGYRPLEREIGVDPNRQAVMTDLVLEPIREVTAASRLPEPIEDAPSSVSIIPGQELRAFAYPTIAEALRGTRGVSLSNDSIYSSVNVRGIGQPNDFGNRLLVLSDGMVMNDDIVYQSYVGYDGRTDLYDIERIEVVRGAGSVLYGTGAISGVVNLVTHDRDSPNNVHAIMGTAENGVTRARVGFQRDIDAETGVWASAAGARSDGRTLTFNGIPGVPTGTTASGFDQFQGATLAGRMWHGALNAQWLYTTRDNHTPIGAYGTLFGNNGTRNSDTRSMGEVRYEPHLNETVQLFLRGHASVYQFAGDYVYSGSIYHEHYDGAWVGAEGRVVLTPFESPRALRISLGATVERHARAALDGFYLNTVGTSSVVTSGAKSYLHLDQPFLLAAVYGLIESSPTDWMRVSAGVRLDDYSTFGAALSPRLAVILKPLPGGALKLMGGSAFRAPSVYETSYTDGGLTQVAGGTSLQPEIVYSGEIEYSQRFLRDWVALVSVHGSQQRRIIDTIQNAASLLQYVNSSTRAETAGFDVEIRREWRQGWMVSAMYGYQRARFGNRFIDVLRPSKDLGRLIDAPEHLASFKGAVPIVPQLATLAVRITAEGPRLVSNGTSTDPFVLADVILTGESPTYGVFYSLGLYNAFDWRYVVPITPKAFVPTLVQNGRTLLLEVGLRL